MESIIRDAPHLAAVLKATRRGRNVSQTDVGATVGLQQKTVSRLESAQQGSCTVESLMKLVTALDLELVIRPKPLAKSAPSSVNW